MMHPGTFVRERLIAVGIISVVGRDSDTTIRAVAEKLGVTRVALSTLLNAHAAVSPRMALRLEKHFGFDADGLMVRQARYDLKQARSKYND